MGPKKTHTVTTAELQVDSKNCYCCAPPPPITTPSGRLGHSAHGGSGWCSLKLEQEKRSTGILITFLGNDLWIYLTVVVVTILYFTTHCHIKHHAYVRLRDSCSCTLFY